jgi:diadenosine tetraphosphate (Ap4A) HIT family hydrolase
MDSRSAPVVEHTEEAECAFCSSSGCQEWFNQPVATEEGCAVAIPSVGSFMPGYLLVVPIAHVTATCRMPLDVKAKFAAFTYNLSSRLSSLYGAPITMFEHGACVSSRLARSACITHAHLHLVPGKYDLVSELPGRAENHGSLEEFLEHERDDPYLMAQDPGGLIVSFEDRPAPQFFRRVIADRLGIPSRWDYALFPFFDNVRRTYDDFGIEVF